MKKQDRRYIDRASHAYMNDEFIRRKVTPDFLTIVALSLTGFGIIVLGVLQMETIGGSPTLIAMVASVFLIMIALIIVHMDRISDLIFSNEFENALFAGAAGTGVEFLLIIRHNREVVYYNPSFHNFFSHTSSNTRYGIDELLETIGVTDDVRDKILLSLMSRKGFNTFVTIITADNTPTMLRLVLNPIRRPKGYFVLKGLRVNEDRILEDRPKETEPITKTLPDSLKVGWARYLEHSPIAVFLLDKKGKITESNAAFRNLIQSSDSNHKNATIFDIIDDGHKEALTYFIQHKDTEDDKLILDVPVKTQEDLTVSCYIHRMDYMEGNPNHFIVYMIDTSEQKSLEQRFVHSQKMQAVGQLAGGVAHDFNNLLTAMIGFCDLLLLRHSPGEDSFADIMQIKQNANRAANLVRQLLAFSRKQTLQPEIVDVTDTLAELSHLVRRLIGENIELHMNHGHDILPVKVDQGQLEQVVINLAVNARDAMNQSEDNGGILTIQTSNVTVKNEQESLPDDAISAQPDDTIEPGNYVCIEVIDTGCGMSHKILDKIFEPFFTTKEIGEGTGLGLSTVCGIIQQTGGYVYVTSQEGIGTRFLIYLQSHEADDDIVAESHKKPAAQDLTGAGTILLVEDEDPVRIFSSRALQNKGYTILEAASGEEALTIMEEQGDRIDMIITDVVMPGITGPSMIEEVMKSYPDIHVIFISGYGEDAFVSSYGSKREFHFLPKPFNLNQLAVKVKEVLEE